MGLRRRSAHGFLLSILPAIGRLLEAAKDCSLVCASRPKLEAAKAPLHTADGLDADVFLQVLVRKSGAALRHAPSVARHRAK
jgi:hypothetical protein